MIKVLIPLVCMFFSLSCWASGQTGKGVISLMYISGGWTQVRVINLDNGQNNPDSCEKSYYYVIHPNDENYNALHSVLLAAQI